MYEATPFMLTSAMFVSILLFIAFIKSLVFNIITPEQIVFAINLVLLYIKQVKFTTATAKNDHT